MGKSVEEKKEFARRSARFVLEPRLNKIAQVTFRTGEGRHMKTAHFLIAKLSDSNVWLDKVTWDHSIDAESPIGKPFSVPLEMVHVIVDLDEVGKVVFPTKTYRFEHKMQ